MTPIEKIREQTEEVKSGVLGERSEGWCRGCAARYPEHSCLMSSLAEDRLKLAEALIAIQSQCAGHSDEFSRHVWQIAERVLADVAGERK